MNSTQKIFLTRCLVVRVILAVMLLFIDPLYAAIIAGAIALILFMAFIKKSRCGFFGGPTWWHYLRLFHATLWALAAASFATGFELGRWIPMADALFGLAAVSIYYGSNYSKWNKKAIEHCKGQRGAIRTS